MYGEKEGRVRYSVRAVRASSSRGSSWVVSGGVKAAAGLASHIKEGRRVKGLCGNPQRSERPFSHSFCLTFIEKFSHFKHANSEMQLLPHLALCSLAIWHVSAIPSLLASLLASL